MNNSLTRTTVFNKHQNNLELNLSCDRTNQTICTHQYTTYPLRLSPVFRLDGVNTNRAYFYTMNTSPGLLAGDVLNIVLQLEENSSLYLTDQAATKVHPMPIVDSQATVNYNIILRSRASLEFMPEPVILYTDAALAQNISIQIDDKAQLFLTEIILPGRLAKGESYQFRYYFNRLKVSNLAGELLFTDAMQLEGKSNIFQESKLFAPSPIMGSAIAVYPDVDLKLLSKELEAIQVSNCPNIAIGISTLPSDRGLLIRAFANKTRELKQYFYLALKYIRNLTNQPELPRVRK
ncbi:MAG: hypothetical protein Tsb0014_45520 [Pleurocapsa sp.]